MMHIKPILGILLVSCIILFISCNDDNDNNYIPNEKVEKAFKDKYPDAENPVWKLENGMAVVSFYLDSRSYKAGFKTNGTWISTSSKIGVEELPEEVLTSFINGSFSNWTIANVYLIEMPEINLYEFEINNAGGRRRLTFEENGTLAGSEIIL